MLAKKIGFQSFFLLLFLSAVVKAQNCPGINLVVSNNDTIICGQSALIHASAIATAQNVFDTISMRSCFNADWTLNPNSFTIPSGYATLGGIPFALGCSGCNNYWSGDYVAGNNPIILAIPLHQKFDSFFVLINTFWGQSTGKYASVELKNGNQILYEKDLYGNIDMRDFNPNDFCNVINGTSTVNVYMDPVTLRRLDMMKVAVPEQYRDSIIDSILFIDNGAHDFQRIDITGLTLETIGDTSTSYLWSTGDTTESINVSPVQSTTYYVSASSQNLDCTSTDSVVVTVLPKADVTINPSATSFCSGDSVQICAPADSGTYSWNTGQSTSCIYTLNPGNFRVTVTENSGCSVTSNQVHINAFSSPSVSITVTGDTLAAYGEQKYQWYLNDTALTGDTNSIFIAHQPGTYSVGVTDTNGCSSQSNGQLFTAISNLQETMGLRIYPDPTTDELNVSYTLTASANLQITIIDLTGKCITNVLNEKEPAGNYLQHIPTGQLASGVYILSFKSENGIVNLRFVKQ